MIIRKTFFAATIIIFSAIVSFSFWYLSTFVQQEPPQFSAYYSALTVAGFDAAGNARGRMAYYRVDGMSGAPIKIYADPNVVTYSNQATFTSSALTITDFSEKEDSDTIAPASIGTITRINKDGHILSVQATDKQTSEVNPFVITKQSPTGLYVVTTELTCSTHVDEGPCPLVFSARIFNTKTLTSTTLQQKDFGLDGVAPLKIDVLDFLSDSVALVQMNSQQELYLQMLGTIDLSTGTFTELQKNFTSPTETIGSTHTFQWLESDRQHAIFLQRELTTENSVLKYVRFDIATGTFTDVTPALKYYPDVLDKTFEGYYFQKGVDQGEWYYDFATKSERQITVAGNVQNFDPASRFVPVTVYAANNGLGPQQVVIQDLSTNRVRQLFNQTVGSMREPAESTVPEEKRVQVGSVIYHLLGIEQ